MRAEIETRRGRSMRQGRRKQPVNSSKGGPVSCSGIFGGWFWGSLGTGTWNLWLRLTSHGLRYVAQMPTIPWRICVNCLQLIYLQRHPKSYIHAIFGPTDTLLYPGVDKLITSLDLLSPTPTFTFTSKRSFLQELGVSEDQFLDIGILVGFDHSLPFPPTVHEQALKATVDMVRYYKSGHAAVAVCADQPAVKAIQYADHYARTRSMIKYSLILSSEGTVQPLPLALGPAVGHPNHHLQPTAADIPQDLHEIFTNRLPDEIYFYLSRGLLSPQALVWLTTGQIVENPPLDNGETTEYKRFVKEVITEGQTGPRATTLALIGSVSHSFWANRKVQGCFWFEQPSHSQKPIMHNSSQTAQLAERVSGWNVPYQIVEEELRRQNVSSSGSTQGKKHPLMASFIAALFLFHLSPQRSILPFVWVPLLQIGMPRVPKIRSLPHPYPSIRRTKWWQTSYGDF